MNDRDVVDALLTVLRNKYQYLLINSVLYVREANSVYFPLSEYALQNQIELSVIAANLQERDVSTHVRHEVAEHIKSLFYIENDEFERRNDKSLIPFGNGYVDIKELKASIFKVHSYSDTESIFIQQIPHPIEFPQDSDPLKYLESKAPLMFKFLSDIVGEENVLFQLQKIGYCFVRDNPFKKFFIEKGDSDAGKTTFITLLELCVGKRNTSRISLQQLADDKFAGSGLFGKLLNFWDDLPNLAITNTGMIKMLTGESPYSADRKHMTPIQFNITAKLIFTTNVFPYVKNREDNVFFGRVILTEYPNKFPKDGTFKERLYTEENISALCTAALLSLPSLYGFGFSEEKRVREIWLRQIDSTYDFISTSIEEKSLMLSPDLYIDRDELYNSYVNWANAEDRAPTSKNTFTRSLQRLFAVQTKLKREGEQRFYAYFGIGLPPAQAAAPDTPQKSLATASSSLQTTPPIIATPKAQTSEKPYPSPNNAKPLNTQGVCPSCGKVKSLYEHDLKWWCLDCLNSFQNNGSDD